MITKPYRYFLIVPLVFLVACGKQTLAPTEIPIPTVVSPTSVPTSTFIPVTITPSPLPTQPTIPMITPDPIQVERWKEYQAELAKLVLAQHSSQKIPFDETALCEWDILGRSGQEVYVWARCRTASSGDRRPAVIHLDLDGSIQKVEVPFHGSAWESTIQKLFPADVREKIDLYFYLSSLNSGRPEELRIHLIYRLTHPEVPPLTILSAMPTPTPMPLQTQPINPAITADSIQVERWQEYEDALAKALFPLSFNDYEFMCEWEILGRSNQEVYVWTVSV